MKQHFVEFFSPGTFVAETTLRPIKSWDTELAMELASGISERYGAMPYGFQFVTRERGAKDLDSHETKRSSMYFLGGRIDTLENGWKRIVVNDNGWRWIQHLEDGDTVLDFTPPQRVEAAQ